MKSRMSLVAIGVLFVCPTAKLLPDRTVSETGEHGARAHGEQEVLDDASWRPAP